jgi:hypothetical protein
LSIFSTVSSPNPVLPYKRGTDFCPSPIFIIVLRLNCFSMVEIATIEVRGR